MRPMRITTPLTVGLMSLALTSILAGASALPRKISHVNQLKGKPAPAISLKTIDDQTVNLPGPRGKVVLIDYWATWCGPCRQQLPHTQAMSADKALAERGLVVLAIDKEETAEKVRPFLEKNNYTFTVPMDADHKFGEAYFVHGLPVTIIIGRDGNVRSVFIGYGEKLQPKIDEAVEDALKQPATQPTPKSP
jgi:peroxiredoxin